MRQGNEKEGDDRRGCGGGGGRGVGEDRGEGGRLGRGKGADKGGDSL